MTRRYADAGVRTAGSFRQGIALGGEWDGAVLLAARKVGIQGALPMKSGISLSGAVFVVDLEIVDQNAGHPTQDRP